MFSQPLLTSHFCAPVPLCKRRRGCWILWHCERERRECKFRYSLTFKEKPVDPTQRRRLKSELETLRHGRSPLSSLLKRSFTTSSCSPSKRYTHLQNTPKFVVYNVTFSQRYIFEQYFPPRFFLRITICL